MPEKTPEDFGFSIQYGVDKNQPNEIDTFQGVVIKNLVENGTAKANITLSDKEMSEIYDKMKDINVLEEKNLIQSANQNLMRKPNGKLLSMAKQSLIQSENIVIRLVMRNNFSNCEITYLTR